MELPRRRVPRERVGWWGKCCFEDSRDAGWVECQVVDISILGAGIEIRDDVPVIALGHRLVAEVHAPAGASISLRLAGVVRNCRSYGESTWIGIEFSSDSEQRQAAPAPHASSDPATGAEAASHTAEPPAGQQSAPRVSGFEHVASADEWAAAVTLDVGGKHVKRGSDLLPPSQRVPRHAAAS